jgi:hypothetical protein
MIDGPFFLKKGRLKLKAGGCMLALKMKSKISGLIFQLLFASIFFLQREAVIFATHGVLGSSDVTSNTIQILNGKSIKFVIPNNRTVLLYNQSLIEQAKLGARLYNTFRENVITGDILPHFRSAVYNAELIKVKIEGKERKFVPVLIDGSDVVFGEVKDKSAIKRDSIAMLQSAGCHNPYAVHNVLTQLKNAFFPPKSKKEELDEGELKKKVDDFLSSASNSSRKIGKIEGKLKRDAKVKTRYDCLGKKFIKKIKKNKKEGKSCPSVESVKKVSVLTTWPGIELELDPESGVSRIKTFNLDSEFRPWRENVDSTLFPTNFIPESEARTLEQVEAALGERINVIATAFYQEFYDTFRAEPEKLLEYNSYNRIVIDGRVNYGSEKLAQYLTVRLALKKPDGKGWMDPANREGAFAPPAMASCYPVLQTWSRDMSLDLKPPHEEPGQPVSLEKPWVVKNPSPKSEPRSLRTEQGRSESQSVLGQKRKRS